MNELIYTIEDDESIREMITAALLTFGYKVNAFENAEDALAVIAKEKPAVCIFDIMLPGMDGIAAVKQIRATPGIAATPVLMLTAKSSELDRVVGLENGADDYLPKPFGIMELCARIKALIRRSVQLNNIKSDVISAADIVVDTSSYEVTVAGEQVSLTNKEFELLKLLVSKVNTVVTRDELLTKIWGGNTEIETRTVDMHIGTLRQKLGDDAENPRYIKTIRGVGYRFISA